MSRYLIRFNKTRGQPGRGSADHAWRIFEGNKEYVAKDIKINVPSWGHRTGDDWNIACDGFIHIDRETSTVIINGEPK